MLHYDVLRLTEPRSCFARAVQREVVAHCQVPPYKRNRTRSVPGSGALPDARTISNS